MSAQLRAKWEALQGRFPRLEVATPSPELPLAQPEAGMAELGPRLCQLGFGLDLERQIWVRRALIPLAEVGIEGQDLDPAQLRLLGDQVPERLSGRVGFFDLETTGLQRGSGTVPFLYGWASAGPQGLELEQWLLPELGAEAPLVRSALARLRATGLLVTYNGASFDLPLLRTRTVMTGLDLAGPGTAHLDLLPLVRRLFRHRMQSCTLRRAEAALLGRQRKDDLEGSEAPERYRHFLRRGDASGLVPVLEHNRQDLLSLARLVARLERQLGPGTPDPSDWYSLGRFAESRGHLERASEMYLGAVRESPPPLDRAGALRRARLLRRQGDDREARAAWRQVWERWQDPEAAEALCVDLEHQLGDLPGALAMAQEALGAAPIGWDRRFAKRIWRIEARLGGPSDRSSDGVPGRAEPERPWAAWLPGGNSYEAWSVLRRRYPAESPRRERGGAEPEPVPRTSGRR